MSHTHTHFYATYSSVDIPNISLSASNATHVQAPPAIAAAHAPQPCDEASALDPAGKKKAKAELEVKSEQEPTPVLKCKVALLHVFTSPI